MADEEADRDRVVRLRPRGLVGIITPWNNPFAIPLGKLAPAIGYGNAVLWKPALAGSGIAALLAQTANDAGIGDFIGLATGDAGTGDAIVGNPRVAALAFTGSAAVGHALVARAGVRPDPIPVQAELGGSNAAIVDESADLDAAATDLAGAMFSFSGQRCTAIRRIILVGRIASPFLERLVAKVEALVIGRPDDPATDVGPLIHARARQRLLDAIASGVRDGARLLCGGGIPDDLPADGCWMQPALLDGLASDHLLNQQEWFGPIATILHAPDFAAAIKLHNASRYGLLGALYSTDAERIATFEAEAQAGLLSINRARPPFSSAGPFSGWKDSGFGIPEHGRWNREFYTKAQVHYRA
jgi:acyl-CoA reductase-like NAD-dependent aldehyde dehydrogenase